NKLCKLVYMISGLKSIHLSNIIHGSYHSGNILIANKLAIMSDLGISKPSSDRYGIIPYVAPEVLRRGWTTKASNIYSFGMIMWELMTGRSPFWDQSHDTNLINKIIDGFRPPVTTNAPEGYVELMKECWHSNPEKRPRICEI
ncbi:kinase-like domain-containing protein, partial [Glomus cerebriforme]